MEPITTELRLMINGWYLREKFNDAEYDAALNLCDQIDAVHRNLEQESETLQDENDGLQESVRMLLTQRDERLAAAERAAERMDGYVKLPVDKDGVSIREDDWMLSLSGKPEQVRGVSREGYYVLRGASWLWMRANRHHHAPNPASVLREFADKLCDLCATEYDCDETRAELLGQYAAKLDALCGRE